MVRLPTSHRITQAITKQRGVTLVELILVLAISSFMIVLALGGINNRGRGEFDNSMKQVLNNLRQVQNEAASGQLVGSNCDATVTNPNQRDLAGCPRDGEEIVGKGVSFGLSASANFGGDSCSKATSYGASGSPATSTAYYEYVIKRGAGTPWNNVVCALRQKQVSLPSAVVLAGIVPPSGPNADRAMINFVRHNNDDANPNATTPPFFFKQAYFSDASGGYFFGTFTPAMAYASYASSQSGTLTLKFQGKDNAAYKASIVIDLAGGSMELKQ